MIDKKMVTAGHAVPLGAQIQNSGVNFAVFSEHATKVELCLFSKDGLSEHSRISLPERDGDVWHGFIKGLVAGQKYGYRAHGPYAPKDGHRFNANKLLIDPYARELTGQPIWNDAVMGVKIGHPDDDMSFDDRDSAPFVPKSIVAAPLPQWETDTRPHHPISQSVIYEAHTKGLTQTHGVKNPGTFGALASDAMLEHYTKLGITAVELLPVQTFVNDLFLVERNLVNYWGYQTLGFFAPDPRYLGPDGQLDLMNAVQKLHSAGIEVVLDVVYNHTCEGNEIGPTLSFRGLDNKSYYRLQKNQRHYVNDTGTGNTLNIEHPMVLRMVMDSLRYWVETFQIDGFRFDLCSTLGRDDKGFDRDANFFSAIRQDPILAKTKLIAEPWDIGPGGYQLGAYPPPFLEWNDKFRDGVRKFWRGDQGLAPELARRITGSAIQFDHSGRPATTSVNLLTAHDGFTLQDVVSYTVKHNEANGENNRDGHSENYSANMGVEGNTDDPEIIAARALRKRNMMATLLLSQGTPMILAGDELGNSQGGNNNAYNQDSPIGWVDWDNIDTDFLTFTTRLIAFRKLHPILRQKRFLHARERIIDGIEDLFWWRANGEPMQNEDWQSPDLDHICVEMRTASGTPHYAAREEAVFAVYNQGEKLKITLPDTNDGVLWRRHLDTAHPAAPASPAQAIENVAAHSVTVFVLELEQTI